MVETARDLLDIMHVDLTPHKQENRLIPRIESGIAPLSVLGRLAGEQYSIIRSDWRSFLVLAAKCTEPTTGSFFTSLAQGEAIVLPKLVDFANACGLDEAALRTYQPLAGCQAYPSYVAWLALNGRAADVILALLANFTAWGSYCATVSSALDKHYGFSPKARAFFDFFATPTPELTEQALDIVQSTIDSSYGIEQATEYGRLLQDYELMFWNTLADS